jgi:RNA polymerase sigma factor (sigma-70 family)
MAEPTSFGRLLRQYRRTRDLTQEVFIAVLKAVREGQLRESDKLAAFIQGTARNIINNFLRTRARRAECDLEDVEVRGGAMVEELELAESQRLMRREIESFSGADQQILVWSLVDGVSLVDIAARLNMSHEAVRARKSRMVKKITRKFAGLSQKVSP